MFWFCVFCLLRSEFGSWIIGQRSGEDRLPFNFHSFCFTSVETRKYVILVQQSAVCVPNIPECWIETHLRKSLDSCVLVELKKLFPVRDAVHVQVILYHLRPSQSVCWMWTSLARRYPNWWTWRGTRSFLTVCWSPPFCETFNPLGLRENDTHHSL